MSRPGNAAPSQKRSLRAFATGTSLTFFLLLILPLAPVGATPSHSRPAKEHGHSTPAVTPPAAALPASKAAEGAAGSAAAAVTPVASARPAKKGTAKHGAAKHSGATFKRHGHTPAGGSTGAGAGAVSSVTGGSVAAALSGTAETAAKVKHSRPHEAKRGRHTPNGSIPAPQGEGTSTGTASPPAVVATPAVAAATASTAAPTPAATSTPATGSKAAAGSGRRRGSHRAASKRHQGAGATAGVLPFTAAIAGEGLAGAAGAAGNGGSQQPAAAKEHGRPRSESPIFTTVTKIINVVPPLMRWLIGGLLLLAVALAVVSQVAAVRARRLARQRRELLDDVGLLQAALLPPLPRRLGPVGTSAAYRPASGPGAGGDFYDVFALGDGRLAVIVGDVSGHGRHALPRTTLVRFTLRAYLEAGMEPRAALQMAGPVLERQLGEAFATVVLATYDPRERTLVYSCAGHPHPVVAGTDSIVPITVCSAPPLGVGSLTGTRQTTVAMPGEAVACFFTDGVVEARIHGQLFGGSRLERLVGELDDDATATTLLDRVSSAVDRRPDDMAACLLRFAGAPAAPAVVLEEIELDGQSATHERVERFLLAGGLHPALAPEAAASVRRSVAEHGRIVLELHYGEAGPEAVVRPLNVAMLQEWRAQEASAQEMAG